MRISSPIRALPLVERTEWVELLNRSSLSFSTWVPAGTIRVRLPSSAFTSISSTSEQKTASRKSMVSSPSTTLSSRRSGTVQEPARLMSP